MRKYKRKSKLKPKRYLRRAAIVCAILVSVLCFLFAACAVIERLALGMFFSALTPMH